jgi:hypothetical protein
MLVFNNLTRTFSTGSLSHEISDLQADEGFIGQPSHLAGDRRWDLPKPEAYAALKLITRNTIDLRVVVMIKMIRMIRRDPTPDPHRGITMHSISVGGNSLV